MSFGRTGSKMEVGVVGIGMMGGSIALAAERAGHQVVIFEPFATLPPDHFERMNRVANLQILAQSASVVLLATPISALIKVATELAEYVRPASIVSDVASAKGSIAPRLSEIFSGRCQYIPSHPMAGSEKSGAGAARANLFANSLTILSPDYTDHAHSELLRSFWETLGSRVVELNVPQHDESIALMSHVPHLLASLLVQYVAEAYPAAFSLAGPGFRDFTRIASGSPALWSEILLANREQVSLHIDALEERLTGINGLLASGDKKKLIAFLDAAKRNRDTLTP